MNLRALALLLVPLLSLQAVAQETQKQYLSGKGIDDAVPWQFFCTAGNRSGEWTTIPVPSCWDVVGFGRLTYGRGENNPSTEQGQYKHTFQVPAAWQGQTVYLVFDGSMTDTQARVNGESAGPMHQGSFYRFKYDVTRLIRFGADNLLEVTVDKHSANASVNRAERSGDYWNFGGIFRPVFLEAVPPQHIERVALDARADGTFAINVHTLGTGAATTVEAQIIDAAGAPVGQAFSQPIAEGVARLTTKIDSPKQWTAETPNLYHVEVRLTGGGQAGHRIKQRFGFRTIEQRDGDGIYVNGVRVVFKGVNRHSFWPDSGRALSERLSREDIALIKEMNMNSVRMSHYPPDEHFLDMCDEMGLYVLDELAGWHGAYDTPTGRRLIEQMIKRDVNHPSIIFWDNGNEGGWNRENDDEFASWDPQRRPVLHPWELFRGIDTKHYPVYDDLVRRAGGANIFMPTEFLHGLFDGGIGAGFEDYWEVMRNSKVCIGGFFWVFSDEAVKRVDKGGALDTWGNMAPDGIVGPYREKEGSFYTVKKIWSPVILTRSDAGIKVENWYDFTNTSQCVFTYQLRKFRSPAESEAGFTTLREWKGESPSIAPRQSAVINVEMPAEAAQADALAVRVDDPNGKELWTYVWPLKAAGQPAELPAAAALAASVSAQENEQVVHVMVGELALDFDKRSGHLISATRSGARFNLSNGPRLLVGDSKLEKIEHRADGTDYLVTATYSGNMKSAQWRVKPDGWLQLSYAFNLDGNFDFFGVGFDLPAQDIKSMRWLGNGPYRVWKNRVVGGTLNVWENEYNETVTGYSGWKYPEFAGYYSDVRWMKLQTQAGPMLAVIDDPKLFVQVLSPKFPADPKPLSPTTAATRPVSQNATLSANAWAHMPQTGFALLHGISPIGTKFTISSQGGPQGQQNRAQGDYEGSLRLFFGDLK